MEPSGEGELLRRRAETLRRLEAEGLCDPTRRRPLVAFPRRVGVIAAHDAKRDVIEHLRGRLPAQNIAFYAAAVRGSRPSAASSTPSGGCRASRTSTSSSSRGGGSFADLVPFDDERLSRAIATSRVPVVTSIGHTKDRPNCDHVAAAYAAVPAKAAEYAVPHSADELLDEFDQLSATLDAAPRLLRERAHAVTEIWERVRPRPRLAGLVEDVEAAADLLASRAEAGCAAASWPWPPRVASLTAPAGVCRGRGRSTYWASSCMPRPARSLSTLAHARRTPGGA